MITPFRIFFAILMVSSIRLRGQEFERVLVETTGIRFENVIQETDTFNVFKDFYAYNGGGVAIGDVNNDGLLDIFFTGTHRSERLYLNKGAMRFEDVTEGAGLVDTSVGCGALIADLDGDGWRDIYVSRRYKPNSYYHNNGDGTFTDLAPLTGLNLLEPTTHAVPLDYDRDGDLDLYIVTNGEPRREGYINPGYTDRLFRNDGNNVWMDVSQQAGIKDVGYGLSATIGDVNNDGWPDIYVANDFEARDILYMNNRNGTFIDRATTSLQHMTQFSMGSDIADVNNDGRLDIMAVDMLPRTHDRRMTQGGGMSIYGPFFDSTQRIMNSLQLNQGNGRFAEIGYYSGIAATDWSWSILAADFDHDGRNDIFITNGTKRDLTDQDFAYSVSAQKITRDDAYALIPQKRLPNFLFHNVDGYRFDDVTMRSGLVDSVVSNGAAYGDLDGDGDLDLVLNNTDTVAFVYRNLTMERGGRPSLRVRLVGDSLNRDGIGARVDCHAGKLHLVREVQPVRGYLSTSSTILHFGLGDVALIDSLVVRWPDGQQSTFANVRPGKGVLTLERTMLRGWQPTPPPTAVFRDVPSSVLPFQHRENFYDDFKRERLLPYRCSQHGPGMAKGDVNGDGLVDVIVTGAKYASSQLYLQQRSGAFVATSCGIENEADAEDVAVALVDIDNDKDLDILLVTGGNEFDVDDPELADRLYRNDGKGMFTLVPDGVPNGLQSGSCIAASDIDRDGDMDVFIGGLVVPGSFPSTPRSYLLRNDKGALVDATAQLAPGLDSVGMTSSALWADVDGDKDDDLIVVGAWMSPRLWRNDNGRFTDATASVGLSEHLGWWSSVAAADIDGDGDQDLIVGNLGENGRYQASPQKPIEVICADFDENGSLDPIMTYDVDGIRKPVRTRMTLTQHMPYVQRRFPRHDAYAAASVDAFIPEGFAGPVQRLRATTFTTGIFRNAGGRFTFEALPPEAQFAPIYGILSDDVDGDGDLDLLLAGNSKGPDGDIVGYESGLGCLLRNDGKGRYTTVDQPTSGWTIPETARGIMRVPWQHGNPLYVVAVNNGRIRLLTRSVAK